MDIISTAILLFMIMDPLGNLPIFLSVLNTVPEERRRVVLIREMIISLIVMLVFLFIGGHLMNLMGLRQESVAIGGGLVLMLIALRMIFPSKEGVLGPQPDGEPFIVPLAIPLTAGPSILAALMVMTHQFPGHPIQWLTAIFLAWGATATIMLFSGRLLKILGKKGIIAMERLMGMILVILSVQLLLDGIVDFVV